MAEPLCKYFNNCGGCSWQHIDYPIQLENKKKALANATRFNDIKTFSGKEYGYRNRMDMVFSQKGLGFRKKEEWRKIVDVEQCAISNERLNVLIKEIRDFFKNVDPFDVKKHTGTFHYAVIRTPKEDSSISFVLNEESNRIKEAVELIKKFAEETTAGNILITYTNPKSEVSVSDDFFVVKGSDTLKEKYLGKEFLFSAQGFFQNNSEMAEKMHEYCHEMLKTHETKEAHLLDLYAGAGTFGINNTDLFKEVTIIESDKHSIDAANKNIKRNNIKNAKAILLDAKQLGKVELPKPLFIIIDPPRSGMHPKTIEQLKKLKPEAMVLVSCNVNQLGKDIPKFKEYEIKSAALFDLFPQTPHSEAIVELVPRKS